MLATMKTSFKTLALDVPSSNAIAILLSQLFEAAPHTNLAAVVNLLVDIFNAGNVDAIVAGIVISPGNNLRTSFLSRKLGQCKL
jgi:hypothetical protein